MVIEVLMRFKERIEMIIEGMDLIVVVSEVIRIGKLEKIDIMSYVEDLGIDGKREEWD